MLLLLLALFIGIPVFEIWLLIEVGSGIGVLATIGVCVVTGVVGAWLARSEGLRVIRKADAKARAGELPTREMIDGLMILLAGVMLMTPGFVTDAVGLLLLTPPVRAVIRRLGSKAVEARLAQGGGFSGSGAFFQFGGDPRRGGYGAFRDPFEGPSAGGPRPRQGGHRARERQLQPDVELLPPGAVRTPPPRDRPDIIDV